MVTATVAGISFNNATDVLAVIKTVAIAARGDRQGALEMIQKLANGQDGVQGTADDVIPAETAAKLRALLDMELVVDLMDALAGKKQWTAVLGGVFACCSH